MPPRGVSSRGGKWHMPLMKIFLPPLMEKKILNTPLPPPLNISPMKFEIVCFCPWWRSSHRGQTPKLDTSLVIIRYSTPTLSDMPQWQKHFLGESGRKYFELPFGGIQPLTKICLPSSLNPNKMESAPDEKNPWHACEYDPLKIVYKQITFFSF